MIFVIGAVMGVWTVMVGTAWVARIALQRSRFSSMSFVVLAYIALCSLSLGWFGLTTNGLLSIGGMLVPLAAALVVALKV